MKKIYPLFILLIFIISCHKEEPIKFKFSQDICIAVDNHPDYSFNIIDYDSSILTLHLGFTDAITPNGDGLNDIFHIKNLHDCSSIKLTIYDRFKMQIAYFDDYQNEWDGFYSNYNENNLPNNGLLHYELIVDSQIKLNGSFVAIYDDNYDDDYFDMSIKYIPCKDYIQILDPFDPVIHFIH